MSTGYRLIFSGRSVYNEISVTDDSDFVGIGTIPGCKARFSKTAYNQDFLAKIRKSDAGWHIKCEAGVYTGSPERPLAEASFKQGDYIPLFSCLDNRLLFKISCLINYENIPQIFRARIQLHKNQQITIGNTDSSNLQLLGIDGAEESFRVENLENYLRLSVTSTTLGIYVNGNRPVGITKVKNRDFISCGPFQFYFRDSYLYISCADRITSHGLNLEFIAESQSTLVYPKFNRNTRLRQVFSKEPIPVLDPPEIPEKPESNLLMTLFPPVVMLVLVVVMHSLIGKSAGMYIIFSIVSMSMGILTSVLAYRKSQKSYKSSLEKRENTYIDYIGRKKEEITKIRSDESHGLLEEYPDSSDTLSRISNFSGSLFDRTLSDSDFLHIRLGIGDRKSSRVVSFRPRESLVLGDALQEAPEKIAEEYKSLHNVPITVSLKETGILGIVGPENESGDFLNVIIEDLCSRQFSKDAMMFLICTQEQASAYAWVRFLPHFQKDAGLIRNIACDKESCDMQFEYLLKILTWREQYGKGAAFPAVIVFVLNEMGLYTHPVSQYLKKAKELGVYFIFLVRHPENLPLYCGSLVTLSGGHHACITSASDRSNASSFQFDFLSTAEMQRMALKLAPVYCEDVSVEGNLPKSFTLFSMLGIQGADDLDLAARWKSADITKTMAAPLGLKSGDEVTYLDLHEKRHGPHGLVAGTTGSGKSEILQTYVLSLATLYSPEEVGFVIIDFKGGGMANLFSDLPHLMGTITDIDGKAINRSLMSIRAEIDKRKKLFAEADVNNIGDYIRQYRASAHGKMTPLPHLILIIDEFAELKADQPEFMKEVISAARVGRSLGIHLILATQKPAGVIDEQIWSNSRFKLCLKVQSQNDSNEVLKSPLAAEIREPGRAYLQVGNNEIFELFQSAYSGGPAQSEEMDHVQPFKLFEVDSCGRKKCIYQKKASEKSDNNTISETQLDAITKKIACYCHQAGIRKLPDICLPALEKCIPYQKGAVNTSEPGVSVSLGIYDDPASQYQGEISVNLSNENVVIIGSAQRGKTNVLQTIIRNLSERYTSDAVNIYVLDFGSMILKNLENLKHIGGVVIPTEEERIVNLFKYLMQEVNSRKLKTAEQGVSSFASYLEAGFHDLPQIVLIIDNLTAFQQLYDAQSDMLLALCREGSAVGISVIVANNQVNGIGYKYLANFSRKIALYCNDSGEYSTLFERSKLASENFPGRALVEINHQILDAQIYLAFSGEREIDRVSAMRAYVQQINEQTSGNPAKPIPVVPELVTLRNISADRPDLTNIPYRIPFGMNYANMQIETIDLLQGGVLALCGEEERGKSNFVLNILDIINSDIFTHLTTAYVIDDSRKKLQSVREYGFVDSYTTSAVEAKAIIADVYNTILDRKSDVASSGETPAEVLKEEPLQLIVISGQDTISDLLQDSTTQDRIMAMAKELRKYKVLVLLSGVENSAVGFSSPAVFRHLKESNNIIFFEDIQNIKFMEIPLKFQREYAKEIRVGDAYSVLGGKLIKVRTILHM